MSDFIRIMFMTIFGKTVDEVRGIISTMETERWAIGEEECPDTGRYHIHVYLELTKKRRFNALGKLFGCHIEPIKNHPKSGKTMYRESWEYTIKGGKYITKGEAPPVTENEIKEDKFAICIELALRGELSKIRDMYPSMYVCHLSKWKTIAAEKQKKDETTDRKCIWIWGQSGIGKSRWVYHHFPEAYRKNAAELYFERYNGEKVICIEDFLPEHKKEWAHPLLMLSDRYPFMAKVRYGSACMTHDILICTSNYRLSEVFPMDQTRGGTSPWQRRFIEVEGLRWSETEGDLQIRDPFQSLLPLYLRKMLFIHYIIF